MKTYERKFPVKKMAKVLKVTRSSYYAWLRSKPGVRKTEEAFLLEKIQKIHEESRRRYGSPNIHGALRKQGIRTSKNRVARIMRKNAIISIQKRRFKATTDSRHNYPVAPNLLNRNFHTAEPNKVWVSDITYIPTIDGWMYLSVVIDLYSRMVVGWALESHMRAELVIDSLRMAVKKRKPGKGLLFHSDRGVQYACDAFRSSLKHYEMIQSMSRKGNCWDNACAESFFGSLKMEEVFLQRYETGNDARLSIFEYIEIYYNRKRQHYSLDFLSPVEYEMAMKNYRKIA